MFFYRPTDGDLPKPGSVSPEPKTCFIATALGNPPKQIAKIRKELTSILKPDGFKCIDAGSRVTGRNILEKIWGMIMSVPVGVAIFTEDVAPGTMANIFYEIGLMQQLGKETLIIKTPQAKVPSDFVQTEYIEFDENNKSEFKDRIQLYIDYLNKQALFYQTMVSQLSDSNPILAVDYYRRAYLLNGDKKINKQVTEIIQDLGKPLREAIVDNSPFMHITNNR